LSFSGEIGIRYARDSEVRELHLSGVGDQQILRLEISVNDTCGVGGGECVCDLMSELEQACAGQGASFSELLFERAYSKTR
jgi:hypothetical protein